MGAWTEVNVCGLYNVELQATGEVAGEGGAERERERSGRGGNKVGGDGAASAIVNESHSTVQSVCFQHRDDQYVFGARETKRAERISRGTN